jgi:hypothetical protein
METSIDVRAARSNCKVARHNWPSLQRVQRAVQVLQYSDQTEVHNVKSV